MSSENMSRGWYCGMSPSGRNDRKEEGWKKKEKRKKCTSFFQEHDERGQHVTLFAKEWRPEIVFSEKGQFSWNFHDYNIADKFYRLTSQKKGGKKMKFFSQKKKNF